MQAVDIFQNYTKDTPTFKTYYVEVLFQNYYWLSYWHTCFVVMVWVALDRGSVIVEGRLVSFASQGIPVPFTFTFPLFFSIDTTTFICRDFY